MTHTMNDAEAALVRQVEEHLREQLAHGAWRSVADLRESIPEAVAQARAELTSPIVYEGSGPVEYGREALYRAAMGSLEKQHQFENRGSNGRQEIRRVGVQPVPQANDHSTPPAGPVPEAFSSTEPSTQAAVAPVPLSPPNLLPPGPATVPVDQIVVGHRHRKEMGDIDALARSIDVLGLLHPPVLLPDRRLVAGRRRLEAWKRLGRTVIPANVAPTLDDALRLLQAERDENECRQAFSPTEAVALGKAIEAIEREQAKQRQRDHGGTAPGRAKNTGGNLPGVSSGTTRDKVAAALGMSGRTFQKAKEVVEAAETCPEQFGHLPAEMDRTGKVDPAYQKLKGLQGSTDTAVDSEEDSETTEGGEPIHPPTKKPTTANDTGNGVTAVSLKLSLKPTAIARVLVNAFGPEQALAVARAVEKAVGVKNGGQQAEPSQRAKPQAKPKSPTKGKDALAVKKGQQSKTAARTSRTKTEPNTLPPTKPPRPGRVGDLCLG